MMVTSYDTATSFLDTAAEWLERQESTNTLLLGLAGRISRATEPTDPPPVMMTVSGRGGLSAATLMTPPRGVILYAPDDDPRPALEALADALLAGQYSVPECVGPAGPAATFVGIWCERTGQHASLAMAQRIYELRKVTFPASVSGSARLARADDSALTAEWVHRFSLEAMHEDNRESARESAGKAVAEGRMLLWQDDGRPVSMAIAARPTRRGIAIAGVYTPPEHRRHGYASACVAALSQRQLDAGKEFCCLYADLANPTSNSIYRKMGYTPVTDSRHYRFEPATDG